MKGLLLNLVVFFFSCATNCDFLSGVESKKSVSDVGRKKRTSVEKEDSSHNLILSSGLKVVFSDAKASASLIRWVNELETAGGSVSHYQAVTREQEVVRRVNSGEWSERTYLEYQRFASGSGNVDSARLMLDFGVGASIFDVSLGQTSHDAKMFASAVNCNYYSFVRLLNENNGTSDNDGINVVSDDGTSLLHAASYGGCVGIVKFIVDDAAFNLLNAVGVHGVTALMTAAAQGHGEIVRILVNNGADIDIPHKFAESTALHLAAEMNQAATIVVICELGGNIDSLTVNNSTALHIAAHSNATEETISALVKNCGINPNSLMNDDTTALYLAAQFGFRDTVIALINNGANHSFAMPYSTLNDGRQALTTYSKNGHEHNLGPAINSEPGNGAQAIHAAAENGHTSTVLALLEKGVDVNSFSMGVTPLHLAAQYNRRDVSEVLIAYHADIDMLSSHDGSTALYYACGNGFEGIVQDLIAAKASVSKIQRSGGFPLLYATMTGYKDIVNQLLLAGANPSQITPDGLTPLHVASTIGSIPIMKMLLSHLPKTTSENLDVYRWSLLLLLGSDKQSLLHSAVLSNKPKMVKYLLQTAVKFTTDKNSFKDSFSLKYFIDLKIESDGGTALHYASRKGYSAIVKILLTYGSNVRHEMSVESFCATPLYLAVHSGNQNIVKMLLHYAPDTDAELCGPQKSTPLLAAIEEGDLNIVQALLYPSKHIITKNEAVIENIGIIGDISISGDLSRSGEILRYKGSDPNKGIPNGGLSQSPILLAVIRGQSGIVKLLLEAHARCNLIVATQGGDSQHGETLVVIARKRRDYDTLQVLLSFKQCDPAIIRKNG